MGLGVPTRVQQDESPGATFFRVAEAAGNARAQQRVPERREGPPDDTPVSGNPAGAQRLNSDPRDSADKRRLEQQPSRGRVGRRPATISPVSTAPIGIAGTNRRGPLLEREPDPEFDVRTVTEADLELGEEATLDAGGRPGC